MAEPALFCIHCRQRIRKLNVHSVGRQKIIILETIARLNANGIGWIKAEQGHGLSWDGGRLHTAYCATAHAIRLGWYGLLDYRAFRGGQFKINALGIRFLKGQASVPRKIWCKEGKVVKRTMDEVFIHQVRKVVYDKEYWDNYYLEQVYDDDVPKAQKTIW